MARRYGRDAAHDREVKRALAVRALMKMNVDGVRAVRRRC